MPIEIKELLIRAFVTEDKKNTGHREKPVEKKRDKSQASLAMVANMLKQEKER
ncbi:MAG: hypothetical protein JWP12_1841 [Bacteroidetes bacterium]|nr:hypothetical protein [Bacteroidota bacterium]